MADSILGISRLSSKFQVTIPKDARERFKLKPGDKILFVEEKEKLILQKG
jgi:AbrB family looped-hinge helix DNA binding protein